MNSNSLSALSFMQPTRIRDNSSKVCAYAQRSNETSPFVALSLLQGFPASCFKTKDRHQLVESYQVETLRSTLKGIMGGEFPPSFRTLDAKNFLRYKRLSTEAEEQWRGLFPDDYRCYDELIRCVIYAYRDQYSGGSVSNRIGWIWLSPDEYWDRSEYLENLIHEYVHNVLFLEEMTMTLFSVSAEVMAQPENQVISSIRRVPRYFDQSYHAAAVAIVLAEAAVRLGDIKKASILCEGILPSLDAIKDKRPLMTDNGWRIFREMTSVSLRLYSDTHQSLRAA